MNVNKAPCYKCQSRIMNCHSKCEKYQEWKNYLNKINSKEIEYEYYTWSKYRYRNKSKIGVYKTHKK